MPKYAESHHEIDGLDLALEDLIFSQAVGLAAENLCQCSAFEDGDIDIGLCVLLLLFPPGLSVNVPGGPVIEVI
jgi:hypothetical protein